MSAAAPTGPELSEATPVAHSRYYWPRRIRCRACRRPLVGAQEEAVPAGSEHSCFLSPPPLGRCPLAVVKFLGGAVPEVTYRHLLELLAKEGFLPSWWCPFHEAATREVFERFHGCYDALLTLGLPEAGLSAMDTEEVPAFRPALLCWSQQRCPASAVGGELLLREDTKGWLQRLFHILSRTCRSPPCTQPTYFIFLVWKMCLVLVLRKLAWIEIGPLFSQVMPMMEASPVYLAARNASGDAWKALFDLAGGFIQEYDQEAMVSLTKFVDQLPSVMNQVIEGVSEFKPTPPENRKFCKNSYSMSNMLLVKFSIDAIDDTNIVEDVLRPWVDSVGGQVKVILSGTHLTPCIQDVKLQVGSKYTPADALAQGLKSLALSETTILSRAIAYWFRSL